MNMEGGMQGRAHGTTHWQVSSTLISSRYITYSQGMVVRQSKGQDDTKGFRPRGSLRERTVAVIDLMEQLTAQKAV